MSDTVFTSAPNLMGDKRYAVIRGERVVDGRAAAALATISDPYDDDLQRDARQSIDARIDELIAKEKP